jgi:hypothetical protein
VGSDDRVQRGGPLGGPDVVRPRMPLAREPDSWELGWIMGSPRSLLGRAGFAMGGGSE